MKFFLKFAIFKGVLKPKFILSKLPSFNIEYLALADRGRTYFEKQDVS
jgi:hypothetical protein